MDQEKLNPSKNKENILPTSDSNTTKTNKTTNNRKRPAPASSSTASNTTDVPNENS